VVGVAYVQSGDEILLVTQQGMMLRMLTDDMRVIGRATQGVRLIDIEDDDAVVGVAKLNETSGAADANAPDSDEEPPPAA
jgi:DNA gyrase subunit A